METTAYADMLLHNFCEVKMIVVPNFDQIIYMFAKCQLFHITVKKNKKCDGIITEQRPSPWSPDKGRTRTNSTNVNQEDQPLPDLPKQSFISQALFRSYDFQTDDAKTRFLVLGGWVRAAYLVSLTLRDDAEAVLVDAQIPVLERPAMRPGRNANERRAIIQQNKKRTDKESEGEAESLTRICRWWSLGTAAWDWLASVASPSEVCPAAAPGSSPEHGADARGKGGEWTG